jgi:hypothetical protein
MCTDAKTSSPIDTRRNGAEKESKVLDKTYLRSRGQFVIAHSWGALHNIYSKELSILGRGGVYIGLNRDALTNCRIA